jgi:hypothetical protein
MDDNDDFNSWNSEAAELRLGAGTGAIIELEPAIWHPSRDICLVDVEVITYGVYRHVITGLRIQGEVITEAITDPRELELYEEESIQTAVSRGLFRLGTPREYRFVSGLAMLKARVPVTIEIYGALTIIAPFDCDASETEQPSGKKTKPAHLRLVK